MRSLNVTASETRRIQEMYVAGVRVAEIISLWATPARSNCENLVEVGGGGYALAKSAVCDPGRLGDGARAICSFAGMRETLAALSDDDAPTPR